MNTSIILVMGGVIILLVVALLILRRLKRSGGVAVTPPAVSGCEHSGSGGCCGGVKCGRKKTDPHIVYFEDEELDAYKGRDAESYSESEVGEFREVLDTLQPGEVNAWLKSLELRKIELPVILREKPEQ